MRGPFSTPITPLPGSFFHADPHTWVAAQRAFALKRWGAHRVASMVLHLDEKTPHIHLVVIPMEAITDGRRKNRDEVRFSLVGRTISGPGRFDQLQDDYAAAMQPFGLVRGVAGSGRKNEPMAQFIARTEGERLAARRAREQIEAERAAVVEQERQVIGAMQFATAVQEEAEAERAAAKAERVRARGERIELERMVAAAIADRDAILRESRDLDRLRTELLRGRDELAAARLALATDRANLTAVAERARAFTDRLSRVSARDLPPATQAALIAANGLRSAGTHISASQASAMQR